MASHRAPDAETAPTLLHPAAPVATFVVSAVSLYLGAAIAVQLFDHDVSTTKRILYGT